MRSVADYLHHKNLNQRIEPQRLCLPIPIAGGRILETGIEDILKLKMSGKLGKRTIVFLNICAIADYFVVPVIAIFTKFDDLVARVRQRMGPSARANLSPDQIKERVRSNADASLQQYILPFLEYTENKIPHIAVSSESLLDMIVLLFRSFFISKEGV